MDLSRNQLPINFKRLIGLKITLVKFKYPKGLTGHFPICPMILSSKHAFIAALSCEQALRDTLAAGREREGELQLRLWNLNSISNYPLARSRLSNQRETESSAHVKNNIEKHVPRVMTSFLMSSPPISISHRCRHSNSRRAVASSPSGSPSRLFLPRLQSAPESLLAGYCSINSNIWYSGLSLQIELQPSRKHKSQGNNEGP